MSIRRKQGFLNPDVADISPAFVRVLSKGPKVFANVRPSKLDVVSVVYRIAALISGENEKKCFLDR